MAYLARTAALFRHISLSDWAKVYAEVSNMMKNLHLPKAIVDERMLQIFGNGGLQRVTTEKHKVIKDTCLSTYKAFHTCSHKVDNVPLDIRLRRCAACPTPHNRDINVVEAVLLF
jgi:hypothetical protein